MLFERAHFVATTPKPKSSKAAALGLKNSVAEMKNPPEIKLEGNKANANELTYFENCIDQLTLTGKQTKFHKDEQAEGQEMPDLNLNIKKI